jgi:predicted O-methyltransferase YrrM
MEKMGFDLANEFTPLSPLIDHPEIGKWYDAAKHDGEFDLVFIDGPKRDEAGMRARICDVMPNALSSAGTVIVDDTDDGDGRALLQRLHDEFGFMFDMHKGPRRQFAVGTREAA